MKDFPMKQFSVMQGVQYMENKSYQLRYLPLFEQDLIERYKSSKSSRFAAFNLIMNPYGKKERGSENFEDILQAF